MALGRRNAAVIGFWLRPVLAGPGAVGGPLKEMIALTRQGRLRPLAGGSYPLADAGRAHEDLLARRSVGKLVLVP